MWTEERIERLTQWWTDGLSATVISERLGQTTRNAVIGKVHRLGLAGRPSVPRMNFGKNMVAALKMKSRQRRAQIAPSFVTVPSFKAEPFTPPADDLVIPVEQRKTLQNLEDHDCRWPLSDVGQPDFGFCNRKQTPGSSYCQHHTIRAHDSPQPQRRPYAALVEKEKVMA